MRLYHGAWQMSGDSSRSGRQHSLTSNERAGVTVLVMAPGRCHQQHKRYASNVPSWGHAEAEDSRNQASSDIFMAVDGNERIILKQILMKKCLCTDFDGLRFNYCSFFCCRSQWPRGLRRRSEAARLLRSWVRIPVGAWMFVYCECCVLLGRGLCDELITRTEESYRLWCVFVCDLETSWMRRPWSALGRSATGRRRSFFC